MSKLSRRDFLNHSAVALGGIAATAQLTTAANAFKVGSATDQVTLGRTGIKTSLIGMGTGSTGVKRSSNQVKLGQEKFNKLVRHAYDSGITYFDTADQYGAHIFLRDALKGLPREKLFIQTKTRATTKEVALADIDRFREELGTDYLDTLLMHCMTKDSWPTDFRPVMDVLTQAKEKKWVRAIGVSCHGMPPLKTAVKTDWIEVDLARINPVGVKAYMDGSPEEVVPCLRDMHDQGKGILGMKVMGQGNFNTPEKQIQSLKFVLGLGCVDAFCIGFEKPEQIDQIIQHVDGILKGKV